MQDFVEHLEQISIIPSLEFQTSTKKCLKFQ